MRGVPCSPRWPLAPVFSDFSSSFLFAAALASVLPAAPLPAFFPHRLDRFARPFPAPRQRPAAHFWPLYDRRARGAAGRSGRSPPRAATRSGAGSRLASLTPSPDYNNDFAARAAKHRIARARVARDPTRGGPRVTQEEWT
ncbi:hypothetical protein [Burkholderia perseverans]|uniref:hypothetical protein n=1 Tax=Burkholderia perseverans TaxID=2615214 RepID=UPI001FEDE8BA|nr:hypothetical protein [Burkholderia perseverans]